MVGLPTLQMFAAKIHQEFAAIACALFMEHQPKVYHNNGPNVGNYIQHGSTGGYVSSLGFHRVSLIA